MIASMKDRKHEPSILLVCFTFSNKQDSFLRNRPSLELWTPLVMSIMHSYAVHLRYGSFAGTSYTSGEVLCLSTVPTEHAHLAKKHTLACRGWI